MQIRNYAVLLTAVMLSSFAQAVETHHNEVITPADLASMQAVVDYCAAVDPRNKGYFESLVQSALQTVRESDVARVRGSAAYREDYRTDRSAYDRLPAGFGEATCAGAVPVRSSGGRREE